MLKLAGELIEGQLADHIARLDAHTYNIFEQVAINRPRLPFLPTGYITDSAYALTANRLYAVPFPVVRAMTIDRLMSRVKTLDDGKTLRIGILNDDGNIYPGTVLNQGGTVDCSGAGMKTITLDPTVSLSKGIYWLACICDGTPDLYRYVAYVSILGGYTTSILRYQAAGIYKDDTYGELPTFPEGGTYHYHLPMMGVRIASLD